VFELTNGKGRRGGRGEERRKEKKKQRKKKRRESERESREGLFSLRRPLQPSCARGIDQ
jgi:hypothetical protein